jgi:hypothetical protein
MRLALAALTALTLLIHGYHPFAEDGGLYVAGIQYTLRPSLFPYGTAFVTAHLHYSIFAPLLAWVVRTLHLPLDWALLLAYIASLLLTFFSARQLLCRCVAGAPAQLGGMALLATWWTLPIAGTSLMLMDPYVTARSFSTPLSLLAIAFALDDWPSLDPATSRVPHSSRSLWRDEWGSVAACACALILAALFHPLMAAYALAFILTLRVARRADRGRGYMLLTVAALVLAATLHTMATTDSPAVVAAAISRYYWFLSQWQWYELLGLAGPLVILAILLRTQRKRLTPAAIALMRAAICIGLIATLVALLFAHRHDRAHLVARLQPLRVFLPIYAVMTLLLGASLTQMLMDRRERTRNRAARRLLAIVPFGVFLALATIFFGVQRSTFPASSHIELPGREAHNPNPWVRAFLWTRANTPPDAVFALDAKYVNEDGEDAQTFRAWSLRSALPDFSKDGGEASITPPLAAQWLQAANAQRGLSTEDDGLRDPRIRPLGATWMIVHSPAATVHACPYNNGTVKVCRLGP